MEESKNSMRKPSDERTCFLDSCDEESGWTMYLEDFFDQSDENSCFSYNHHTTPSLVSDAASLPVMNKKNEEEEEEEEAATGLSRLSFKKRNSKRALVADDALEDTATSALKTSKEKEGRVPMKEERREDMGSVERESDIKELKKRGLCLVPVSMVVHYLG